MRLVPNQHYFHPSIVCNCFIPFMGSQGFLLEPIPAVSGRGQGTPWTSCQLITGPVTDGRGCHARCQPHIRSNLGFSIFLVLARLLEVTMLLTLSMQQWCQIVAMDNPDKSKLITRTHNKFMCLCVEIFIFDLMLCKSCTYCCGWFGLDSETTVINVVNTIFTYWLFPHEHTL